MWKSDDSTPFFVFIFGVFLSMFIVFYGINVPYLYRNLMVDNVTLKKIYSLKIKDIHKWFFLYKYLKRILGYIFDSFFLKYM